MSPSSSVDSSSMTMPRAIACSTKVVVTHPASACSRNSTGFAPSLAPSSTGGSPLVNSQARVREASSALAPKKSLMVERFSPPLIHLFFARNSELRDLRVGLDRGDRRHRGVDVEAVDQVRSSHHVAVHSFSLLGLLRRRIATHAESYLWTAAQVSATLAGKGPFMPRWRGPDARRPTADRRLPPCAARNRGLGALRHGRRSRRHGHALARTDRGAAGRAADPAADRVVHSRALRMREPRPGDPRSRVRRGRAPEHRHHPRTLAVASGRAR